MALDSLSGHIETWRLKHRDENGWTGLNLQKLYVSNGYIFCRHLSIIFILLQYTYITNVSSGSDDIFKGSLFS